MSGHGHSHGCGECDHSNIPSDAAARYSLYKFIDTENLQCLNEETPQSGKTVFKPYDVIFYLIFLGELFSQFY